MTISVEASLPQEPPHYNDGYMAETASFAYAKEDPEQDEALLREINEQIEREKSKHLPSEDGAAGQQEENANAVIEAVPDPLCIETCAPILPWIDEPPPPREDVFQDLLGPGEVAGIISAGGVGKTALMLSAAVHAAIGRAFGPFVPPSGRKIRSLILNVEDASNRLRERIYQIGTSLRPLTENERVWLQQNMLVFPGRGIVKPFMIYDFARNPIPSAHLDWLQKGIHELKPDLLVIDTKSRLFGLEENSNSDTAAWISSVEALAEETQTAIIIIHHQSKLLNGSLDTISSRGASAFTDNLRLILVAAECSESEGKRFGFSNHRNFFKVSMAKSNYNAKKDDWYFERGTHGILRPLNPQRNLFRDIAVAIAKWLSEASPPIELTRKDITKNPAGKVLRDYLKDEHSATRTDIETALSFGCQDGILQLENLGYGTGGGRERLVVRAGAISDEH